MSRRELFRGYRVDIGKRSGYQHFLGGENGISFADCPNCVRPLMLHATLDTTDPRFAGAFTKTDRIPLLYCSRCALCWYEFAYRIIDDATIRIVRAHRGETTWDDWYEEIGLDVFPRRPFDLQPLPERVQLLYDRLNQDEDLSRDEEEEIAAFTGQYAIPEVGGHPCIDVINQIGGRAFLSQRLADPFCAACEKRSISQQMFFLASLTNEPKHDFVISYAGVQIVFFYCPTCGTVSVEHSV